MIARFLSLAVVCVLFSVYANAQTNKNNTVSKGYYSIGNNAEKLHNNGLTVVQTNTYYTAQKGYFTISENGYKLPKFYRVHRPSSGRNVPVKKGYYSIGSNNEKLN